eukprot:TRINITY_DN10039_c0_g1_i1.p1 TRINITY_DN10039_c0_g1~~TRINITY_DN10039_c0_g1_i1.p1  ORF type:complete len:300 (+),score=39.16 TRINITY_DN10039_c0_g1_i1:143-1042(+)
MGNSVALFMWKNPDVWAHIKYDYAHFAVAICYLIVLLVAIFCFWMYRYNSRFFMVAFLSGVAARFLFFVTQPLLMENMLNLPHPVQFIISTAPSFFFFSAYLMILFFWGDIYNKTTETNKRRGLSNRVFLVFILINIVMYVVVLVLYLLNSFLERNWSKDSFTPYEKAVLIISASMYVLTSASFFCYGYYVYRSSHRQSPAAKRTNQRNKLLTRVGTITLFCMFCFLVRAAVTLWGVITPAAQWYWWLDGVYYFLLEVIPVSLLLGAYVKPRQPAQGSINNWMRDSNSTLSPLIRKMSL